MKVKVKTEDDNEDLGGTLVVKVEVKTEDDNGDSGGTLVVKVETAETVKVPTRRRLVVG